MKSWHSCSLLLATTPGLGGCTELVPLWGNTFALLLTLAIFVGTLSLSKKKGPPEPPGLPVCPSPGQGEAGPK